MANHPSAEKRNRQRIKRTTKNRAVKSSVRTIVKRVRVALLLGVAEKAAAQTVLKIAIVAIDKAASKGVIPKKTASRKISRLSAQVHKLA